MKSKLLKLLAILVLIVGVPSSLSQASSRSGAYSRTTDGLSTPQLLQAALDRGDINRDTYLLYLSYALGDFDQLPAEYHGSVPWYGTQHVLYLQQEAPAIQDPLIHAKVAAKLAGDCLQSGAGQPNTDNTSANFHIQYDAATIGGASGLTLADYRTSLDNTWNREVTTFGWAAPPVSTNPPPGNRYHVLIASPFDPTLYGYVSASGTHAGYADGDLNGTADGDNPNTAWTESNPYWAIATCMVLNDDYSGFPGGAQFALDATTGHEFHHSLQFGYGVLTTGTVDDAFMEGSATWMEDEVNDASNDNYNYLWPQFTKCMGEHPTAGTSAYAYWLTFRGLTERYGTTVAGGSEQVMQNYWEYVSNPATNVNGEMLVALDAALGMAPASTNLPDAYHAYAIAAGFMRTCGGGYVYPYCFEEASSYVSYLGSAPAAQGAIGAIGSSYSGSVEDNYALNWIDLPTSGIYAVTLQNTSGGGQLRGSVVCDDGSQLNVTALPAVVGAGGSTTLSGFNAAGCNRVLAVITNQSQTADNPASCTARSYQLSTAAVSTTGWSSAWVQINESGFDNDPQNEFASALVSFNGELWAGTYNSLSGEGFQLWRMSSSGEWYPEWEGDPSNSTTVAVDHMIVFSDTLFVSFWDETNGGVVYSFDGTDWSEASVPGFGDPTNGEVFRMAVFSNTLYASTWSYTSTHGAEIWRSSTGTPYDWTQVVSDGFGDTKNEGVPTFAVFNNTLYAGTFNATTGGELWRSTTGNAGSWSQVNTDGFGNANNRGISALAVFNNYLYASTRGNTGFGIQVWRCQVCNGSDWVKVADNGFGNADTNHASALEVFDGHLYLVVGNMTTGLEVRRTADGTNWVQIGFSGFDTANNRLTYWDSAVAVHNGNLYVGTINWIDGGEVWLYLPDTVYLPMTLRGY